MCVCIKIHTKYKIVKQILSWGGGGEDPRKHRLGFTSQKLLFKTST